MKYMVFSEIIKDSITKLYRYMISEGYKGYDPYDTLLSPLFSYPVFNTRIVRFGAQQVAKRIPISLRGALFIRKGLNPVTAGLSIQAYSYLLGTIPEQSTLFQSEIAKLQKILLDTRSTGYSGSCWGYNFDWEARFTRIDAYVPTSVATGIITNGLFEHYKLTGNSQSFELCKDATLFVMNDLNKQYQGDTFCYSYSPVDQQYVLNSSMKALKLLSQVYSVTKDNRLREQSSKAVRFVAENQRPNGSWPYAINDPRSWADNYHTGYVLDCLDSYMKNTDDYSYQSVLDKGVEFYVNNFFSQEGAPKFYHDKIYPIDATAAAQSLLTLSRFGYMDLAEKVAIWTVKNLQNKRGGFYFRKHKYYTDKSDFMRWSNAWMFTGLAYLLFKHTGLDSNSLMIKSS